MQEVSIKTDKERGQRLNNSENKTIKKHVTGDLASKSIVIIFLPFYGMPSIFSFAGLAASKLMFLLLSTSHSFIVLMGTLNDVNWNLETE